MTDLAFHVREFLPECQGEELEQRKSLLVARDYAADLRGKVWSRTALEHAATAHELADYFYKDETASPDRLKIALAYCRNLVHAAFLVDHLEQEVGL
jgi:hypothetical protein